VKAAVDRLGTVIASRFGELGGKVRIHKSDQFGNHLEIRFGASSKKPQKPVLLLGHMDTVHAIGTISKMPYRVRQGRVCGPGVLDMKSGIALALHAIEALLEWNRRLPRPVTVFLVSDEEVGSRSSRAITEDLAQKSAAVLVLEPAAGLEGALKTARKGVGEYTLRVQGKAAHSGLDPSKGQSAVLELAKQIVAIATLADSLGATTLNVGKIGGGTRTNVVPAEAWAVIDARVTSRREASELDRQLRDLRAFNASCKITITGAINRPPLERTTGVAQLFAKAAEVAGAMNWELKEASVGGGSDGNFTAALGVPTLDGLGAVGEGAHSADESIVISELPRRAALLASLLQTL